MGQQTVAAPLEVQGYVTRQYTDSSGATMVYYLYIPPAVLAGDTTGGATRYPVVLLLHGGGERANPAASAAQNRSKIANTPYVRLWTSPTVQAKWPSFVIVPQIVGSNRWVNVPAKQGSYTLAPTPTPSLTLAHEIMEQTLAEYASAVNTHQVYVTGISMGGYGTWDAIERWPQDFAAAAPVSGAGDPSQASALAQLPIWDFHGALDTTVPISGSQDMINAITAAGGDPRFTIFPTATHQIWVQVYSNTTFLAWLFAQHSPA